MKNTEQEILEHLRIIKNIVKKDKDNIGGQLCMSIDVTDKYDYISFFNRYWENKEKIDYTEFNEAELGNVDGQAD